MLNIILRLIFRKKIVFMVGGMRRSGNHAFINWFSGALNRGNNKLDYTRNHFVGLSHNSYVIHLNEVNVVGILLGLKLLCQFKYELYHCKYLIISQEDNHLGSSSFLCENLGHQIFIQRSLLNLIASRIQGIINRANQGIAEKGFQVDETFLDCLISWREAEDITYWSYDEWLGSSSYRQNFLSSFSLSNDNTPSMSRHGGGSSFSLGKSNKLSATSRFEQIEWSKYLINILKKPKYKCLLNSEELKFLLSFNDLIV